MTTELSGHGKRLRVYIGESDHYHSKPFYEAIVFRLREEHIAGATVIRGIEGYGARSRFVHTANVLRWSSDLPIIVEIIDTGEKILRASTMIKDMLTEANCGVLMTVEPVEILYCSA